MEYKEIKFATMLKSTTPVASSQTPIVYTNDLDSIRIVFDLMDCEPSELDGGSAYINMYMTDGSFFHVTADILPTAQQIICYLSESQGNHIGMVKAQAIFSKDNKDWASAYQRFEILGGLEGAEHEIEIHDWSKLINDTAVQLGEYEAGEVARTEAETARQTAENDRALNEDARTQAELGRIQAELGRVDAELLRNEAESTRQAQLDAKINEPTSEGTAGQALVTDGAGGRSWQTIEPPSNFTDLDDTPADYTGHAGKVPMVKSTEDGLEFITPVTEIPIATETALGGVMAKAKTTEVGEIAIDPDGRLFSPALPPTFYSEGEYVTEDFEDLAYAIPFSTTSWARSTADKISGAYSMMSKDGYAADNSITFTIDAGFSGTLSFWYRVNKQVSGYTTHLIELDGSELVRSTSPIGWTHLEIPISAGEHTLYINSNLSSHSYWSRIFVDDLSFPGQRQYFHGIQDHSEMPNILDNRGKLLKASDDGSALEFIPQDTFVKTPSAEGTAGQVLMTDGAGGRSWGDIVHPSPMVNTGTELPTADISYRGQIFTVLGDVGVADTSYVCQKDATDAYAWVQLGPTGV